VEETPLPWEQFCIVLFFQLVPLTSQFIYPLLPQSIRNLEMTRGDASDTKVGYHVGIWWCQSIFFCNQTLTIPHLSRAPRRNRTKPAILL
ncbi:hypothetical protein BD410DRAFT_876821, partial [Rickenella mellea]